MAHNVTKCDIPKKREDKLFTKNNLELFILTIPALVYFLVFHYLPMFGVVLAFKNFNYELGIFGSEWIGFKNFEFFFSSQDAWRITRNTLCYSSVFIVTNVFSAVFVALLLYEVKNRYFIKSYQTIMILPHFISWVIVGYITYIMLNPEMGVFNKILSFFGFNKVDWYSEIRVWPFILVSVNIWKHVGMNCIIYYAALLGINKELFEAAMVDGANKLQQTWYISVQSLKPLVAIMIILSMGSLFRGDFGLFYQIPRDVGLLYPVTDVIDTYAFRGLRSGELGSSSAVGLLQSFVGFLLVVGTNAIVKKINPENSLY